MIIQRCYAQDAGADAGRQKIGGSTGVTAGARSFHGEAKTWHGLARAIRRGLDNMRIQSFLIAPRST